MTQHLNREWLTYRNGVIPRDAPSVQLTESRRAFYAGAWAFYQLLMNRLEERHEETPADMAFMAALDAELRAFNDAVKAGTA